jgi:hypothetical protein
MTVGTVTPTTAALTWAASSDNVTAVASLSYTVRYGTTPIAAVTDGTQGMAWSTATLSTTVTGLTPNKTYYVRVFSKDAAGNVAPYGEQTVSPVPNTVQFTTIGCTSNGNGWTGLCGTSATSPTIYFIGTATTNSGYFQVLATGGNPSPGVTGSGTNNQAYFTVWSSSAFSETSFDVYNPGGSSVTLTIAGWSSAYTNPPGTGDIANTTATATTGWSTVTLTGFTGMRYLTIDFPDTTTLYFNNFKWY